MATKPPLVLIHGMFCGPWHWESFRNYFTAAGYSCHVPALRFHDLPLQDQPHPQLGQTSVREYKEELKAFIKALPDEPVLIGHSMGGLLVQMLLADGVGKGGVCLTPASPYGIWALTPSVVRTFWHVLTTAKFWKNAVRLTFNDAKFGMLNRLLPEEQWRVYNQLGWESGRAIFEIGLWPLDIQKTTKIDYSAVQVPILFIGARCDRVTPVFAVRRTSAKYSHAEFVELPNHAHWVLQERGWERIADQVLEWIARTFPA